MKRLIHFILTVFLVFGICFTSLAQTSLTANAEVLEQLTIVDQTALDFGGVAPTAGQNKTVNADGSGNDGDVTVGEFTVSGSDAAAVTLDFTTLEDLTDGSGNTLTIDYNSSNYGLWSTDGDNSTSADNTVFNPDIDTPSATLDSDGISVFIGGEAQPVDAQPAGTYTGTITLTATYN